MIWILIELKEFDECSVLNIFWNLFEDTYDYGNVLILMNALYDIGVFLESSIKLFKKNVLFYANTLINVMQFLISKLKVFI